MHIPRISKFFFFTRLRSRLIFFVSLGIVTGTLMLYFFISRTQQKLMFDSFYASTNGTLQAAKLGIELSHSEEKYEMLLQVFNWIKKREYFSYMYLTEFSEGSEEILGVYPETEDKTCTELNILNSRKSLADPVYVLKTGWSSNKGKGNLYIGFSTERLKNYEDQIIFDLTSFSLITLIIIIIAVALITTGITKPLNKLKSVTDEIRRGDLNKRADEIKGGLEVTSVSKAFNQMVDELSNTQKELSNEIYEAGKFVRSILPEPLNENIKIDWRFYPSRFLGGDAFGYHYIDKNNLAIYLIDVSGHGVGPALLSVSVINILRTQSLTNTDFKNPGNVLESLNNIFQMDKHGDKFFTIWYGVLNTESRELNFSAGGHPPAILVRNDAVISPEELSVRNNFIGFMPDIKFISNKIVLGVSDKLYIYSDGLYEIITRSGKALSKKRFLEIFAENYNNLDTLLSEIKSEQKDKQFEDDCSIIGIEV